MVKALDGFVVLLGSSLHKSLESLLFIYETSTENFFLLLIGLPELTLLKFHSID